MASLSDPEGVGDSIRKVAEDGLYLLRRFQIELIAVVSKALGVLDGLARANAEQNIVRPVIGLPQVVHIVGADEGEAEVLRNRLQATIDDLLLGDALKLHLEEEVVGSEDVTELGGGGERLRIAVRPQRCRDFTFQAAAEADQPCRVLGQQLLVNPWTIVEPLHVARRHQLDEIVIALLRLREQNEVVGGIARTASTREPAARRHVDLAADDRLDSTLPRRIVECDRREHVAVLGDCHRRHLKANRLIEHLIDSACAVEQRELGMQMQVNKTHGVSSDTGHGLRIGSFPYVDDRKISDDCRRVRRQPLVGQRIRSAVTSTTYASPSMGTARPRRADYSHSIVEGGLVLMS